MTTHAPPAATLSPWSAAVAAHTYLLSHPHLPPIHGPAPAVDLEWGELVVGVFDTQACAGLGYARWAGTTVIYHTPGSVVAGSPQFVTGYLLGTLAMRARARRRAHREAVPRWWPIPLLCLVVTTQYFRCLVAEPHHPARWISIGHTHVTEMALTGDTLTASFGAGQPLRLAGPWAPWCAAVMARHRYGPDAGWAVPTLHHAPR